MNATELLLPDHRPSGVWFCQHCRSVSCTQQSADRCCTTPTCTQCGQSAAERGWTICRACFDTNGERKEKARFEKANKLTPEQYDGVVYREGHGNDGYAESLDELLKQCEDDGCAGPDYVWACRRVQFVKVSLDRILEDINEAAYEDFDPDDLDGLPELQAAIAVFQAANAETVAYEPDFSTAIIVPQKPEAENPED